MKNKQIIIISIVIAVVVVGAVVYFLFFNKKTSGPVVQAPVDEEIITIQPEEIGLSLAASADNRKVILQVANTKGIVSLDYELSYTSKGDIPRGVIGNIDIKVPGNPVKQEIVLGTCSDVCHYDEDVSDVKLILKVVKTDGTTSQVEKSLDL